jgi:hypothetical protein
MPIAKITRQGVAAIALAVALLWGFLLVEHFELRQALDQRARVLRELRELQRRGGPVPVSAPSPLLPHRFHITDG